jgi:DNA modification methylase
LKAADLGRAVVLGLPEIDDRYHVWRVPLRSKGNDTRVGEVVIDAFTSLVVEEGSTRAESIEARLLGRKTSARSLPRQGSKKPMTSALRNTVMLGDNLEALQELPAESVDLVFTSPPYYNARPEYSDHVTYEEYLLRTRRVLHETHRALGEGRFFVINVSPVLVRRASRQEQSKRLAVPFDIHHLFTEEGYDFIDDIIWVKPEGAGWALGRGRRFAADRNPLQYKPVPVTEYVLVYRKHTEKLIDWNVRGHPRPDLVQASKIPDGYERTNVWHIKPASRPEHPAVFPMELAEKVVTYYSFRGDVVLDPYAGIGTVGQAAAKLGRRFVLIEKESRYVDVMRQEITSWMGSAAREVLYVNCDPPDTSGYLF